MNSPPPTMSPSMPDFQPRREFVAQSDMAERVPSEIALLALSGVSLLRLCSFSPIVINDLRYFLSHTDAYSVPTDDGGDPASLHNTLLRNFREDTTNHLVEFALDGRPWTISKQRPGALHAEHLFVQILTIILRRGYTFVTQVDYGREHDDRVSIVFSRSLAITRASTDSFDQIIAGGSGGGSSTGLQGDLTLGSGSGSQDEVLVAFALSFASATELRVIKPPLDSTPAILHAVRTSWPRGVVSEKKISHDCYQFKLKGYHWFQQDTFSLDSLRHIQTLLTSLDAHGFTLLTSLSLSGNHSRVKDLWIFTGMGTDTDLSLSLTHTRARSQNNVVNANINGSPVPGQDAHIPTPESSESSNLNLAGIGAQTQSPGVHYVNEDPPRSSSVLRKKAGHRKSLSNPSNPFSPLHSGSLNGAKPSPRTATTTLPLPSTPPPRQAPTSPTRIPVPIHEVLYTTPVRSPSPYGTQPYAHQQPYPYPQPDASMGMGVGVSGGAPASGYPDTTGADNNQQVHFWTPQRDDRHDAIGTRDAAGGIGAGAGVGAGMGIGMGAALAAVDVDANEESVPVDPKLSPNAGWATQRRGVPRDVPQSVSVFPDGVEEDIDVAGGLGIVPNTIPSQPISQHTPSPTPSTPHLLSPGVFRDSAFSSNTDDASGIGSGTRLSGDSMGYLFGGPGARGTMGTVGSMNIPIAWTGAIDAVRSQSQSQSPAQRQVQVQASIGGERVDGGRGEDVQVYAPNTEEWGKTEEELHGQVRAAKATLLNDHGGADADTRLHGSGLGPGIPVPLALALAPELHNTNTSTSLVKKYNDDAYDDTNNNGNENYKSAPTYHASDIPTNGNVTTEADIRNNDTTADARLRDHNVNVNVLLIDPYQTETGNPNATQNENPNPKINDIANVNVNSEFMGKGKGMGQGSSGTDMSAPDGDLDLTQHVQSSSVLTRSPDLKNEEKKDEEKGSGVNVQMEYNPDTDRDHPTDPSSTPNQALASAIGSTPILPLPLPIHDSTHHGHDQGTPAAGNTPTRPRPPPSFNRFETSSTLEFSFPGAWQPTLTLEKSAAQASFPITGAAAGGVPTLADDPHTLTLPAPADHANQSLTALPHEGTQAQGNAGPVSASAGTGSHQSHHADYPTHKNRNDNDDGGKNRYDGSGSGEWNSRGPNSNPPLRSSPPSVLYPLAPGSASGASANVNETDPGKSRLSGDSDLRLPGYLPLDEGEGIAGGNADANVSVVQGPTGVIADPQYPTLLLTSIPLHKVVDAERAVSPDALSRPPLSGGSDHKSEVAIIEHLRGGSKEAGFGESGENGSGEPKKKEGWVMIDVDSSVSKGGLIKSTDYAVHSTGVASTSTTHPSQSQAQSQDQASGDTTNPPMTPPVEQASSMSAVAKVIAATDAIAPADPDSVDVLERSRGIVDAYAPASPAPATPSHNKGSGSVRFASGEEKQGHSRSGGGGGSGSGSGSATSSSPSPSSSSTIRRLFSRSSKSKASSKSKLKP